MVLGKLESHMQKMKLEYSLPPCSKINSKWIEDPNIRSETINYIEENRGTKLTDLGLREDFMNLTPKAREVKAKINERDCIRLKNYLYCIILNHPILISFIFNSCLPSFFT